MTRDDDEYVVLKGLRKSFGRKQVLDGLDLTVKRGESMVVIGGSGTGKSVLIKCIQGLLAPDAGEIWIKGREQRTIPARELNELRKRWGMLFQYAALFDSLPVWLNVGFGLKQHTKLSTAEIRAIAIEKLRQVGLTQVEDMMPADLSGGMKKRVGLARAIAMDPEFLFYDEPTTGLDPIMADVINELIVGLNHGLAVTSIAITHDMASAYKIADRIAMLYQGKIHFVGTPDEIRATPDAIVQQFIQGRAEGPITDALKRDWGAA
ncbi:MAG: ABC transporter ATP-binding protein [bacterium]